MRTTHKAEKSYWGSIEKNLYFCNSCNFSGSKMVVQNHVKKVHGFKKA